MNRARSSKSGTGIKVLMFVRDPSWGGGVVNYVGTLINHLSDRIKVEQFRIGQRPGPNRTISRFVTTIVDMLRLVRQLRCERYDVVHVNPSLDRKSIIRDGIFLLILKLMGVRNSLVFIHGWSDIEASRIQQSGFRRFLFQQTFGSGAAIVVLGSKFKRELASMGLSDKKVMVTTTMFDSGIFSNTQRQKFDDIKRIIFLARIVKEKGVFELLEAFRTVAETHDDCVLILAGDGPEMGAVKKWVRENSMDGSVQITGYVQGTAKGQILVDADIFVLPTYHGEGCPVAVLEAMAAGLPIISTAVGGIPDILEGGQSGILLKDTSPNSISAAILSLMNDEAMLKSAGEYNKSKATTNYEASIVAGQIEKLYGKLASRR